MARDRKDGFYWVKSYDMWVVAQWNMGCWAFPEYSGRVTDSDLQQIDERKIINPNI